MTDILTPDEGRQDGFLRQALLLANSSGVMGLIVEEDSGFSPAFERGMEKLLADPFRRARKEVRPLWRKVLRSAAVFLLIVATAFSAAMLNPTARAWFQKVVTEWTDHSSDYIFRGTADSDPGIWIPGYLPPGYQLIQEKELNGTWTFRYENSGENQLEFSYLPISQSATVSIDNEHSDREPVQISGHTADLYRSNTYGYPSYLLWTDRDERVFFVLISEIDPDELIKIAKSVVASP